MNWHHWVWMGVLIFWGLTQLTICGVFILAGLNQCLKQDNQNELPPTP